MNEAKIQFSTEELSLAINADWILTKNKIISKICDLFSSVANEMRTELSALSLPAEILQTTAKISKGENYKGLPYVVLDYPRLFTKEHVFAVRVLFWWANYFSVTLHLKGMYKEAFLPKIEKRISFFSENNFYINITANEWQHALHESDYALIRKTDAYLLEKYLAQDDLLKLSVKLELDQWNESEQMILQHFKKIMQVVKN